MLTRTAPFHGSDQDEIYDGILADNPVYPPTLVPADAKDLLQKLLSKRPRERLGYHKGAEEIMSHEFFETVDWGAVYRKEVVPPFIPVVEGRDDLRNFDDEHTSQKPVLTPVVGAPLTPAQQSQFSDFASSNET